MAGIDDAPSTRKTVIYSKRKAWSPMRKYRHSFSSTGDMKEVRLGQRKGGFGTVVTCIPLFKRRMVSLGIHSNIDKITIIRKVPDLRSDIESMQTLQRRDRSEIWPVQVKSVHKLEALVAQL